MTDVVFVHAPEREHPGGGADVRARALSREVGKHLPTELLVVGTGGEIETRPSLRGRARAAIRGVPPRFSQRFDPKAREAILRRVDDAKVVVAETLFVLPYLFGRRAQIVLDAHNVESEVVRRLADRHPSRLRRLAYGLSEPWSRSWEASAAKRVAQTWAVSEDEARWFQAADVVVVPNGVDVPAVPPPLARDPSLVFVGSLRAQFNRAGLAWFLAECWSAIRSRRPDAVLHLVGEGSDSFEAAGVIAHGFAPDLAAVYQQSRVAIVPLLDGAGTRLKALEAMAQGRPVVSTTIGVAGIDLVPGHDVAIADTAADFADACLRLLGDETEASRLAVNGRHAVSAYDWTRIGETAAEALGRLL